MKTSDILEIGFYKNPEKVGYLGWITTKLETYFLAYYKK